MVGILKVLLYNEFRGRGSNCERVRKISFRWKFISRFKPVLWSTVEKIALADAEVEYLDHTSDTIHLHLKLSKQTKISRGHKYYNLDHNTMDYTCQ